MSQQKIIRLQVSSNNNEEYNLIQGLNKKAYGQGLTKKEALLEAIKTWLKPESSPEITLRSLLLDIAQRLDKLEPLINQLQANVQSVNNLPTNTANDLRALEEFKHFIRLEIADCINSNLEESNKILSTVKANTGLIENHIQALYQPTVLLPKLSFKRISQYLNHSIKRNMGHL